VGANVELGRGVEVGPFCFLDGNIRVGAGTRMVSHVTLLGDTELGAGNVLHSFVVIGDEPQDLTYCGGARQVRIGNRNIFREGATVHRGSERGAVTIMGDDNFMMQNSHVAHDSGLAIRRSSRAVRCWQDGRSWATVRWSRATASCISTRASGVWR